MPMSLTASSASERHTSPPWLFELLGLQDRPAEGEQARIRGRAFANQDGNLREQAPASGPQQQTGEEMNHINFDWYAPANAHRQTPKEVHGWCAQAGLAIEREVIAHREA